MLTDKHTHAVEKGPALMIPGASAPGSQLRGTLFLKDRSEWQREGRGREEKNGGFRDVCSTKGFTKGLKQDEH